jgi:hypothetical protein
VNLVKFTAFSTVPARLRRKRIDVHQLHHAPPAR